MIDWVGIVVGDKIFEDVYGSGALDQIGQYVDTVRQVVGAGNVNQEGVEEYLKYFKSYLGTVLANDRIRSNLESKFGENGRGTVGSLMEYVGLKMGSDEDVRVEDE